MKSINTQKIVVAAGAIAGWFAIIAQLVLIIQNRVTDIPEAIIRFFSYFTILTNILVALCFTLVWIRPEAKNNFLSSPKTKTALAVYILVVGIIYNVILRFLWAPTGLQKIADELLHLVIPLLFVIYWIYFVPKEALQWKNAFTWLLYPFIYLLYILARGAVSATHFYPYPFVDVYNHGYEKVLISCALMLLLFLMLSFIFIWAGRFAAGKKKLSI
ncbi:MAG TPA: Pr6Pr family membrane protein [Ferruginibacter sp.]|nr:Pr6Pr family membrane protein [Ferruginibacter sp.]